MFGRGTWGRQMFGGRAFGQESFGRSAHARLTWHERGARMRLIAQTVAATALVTTLFWLAVALWWFHRPSSPGTTRADPMVAAAGNASQSAINSAAPNSPAAVADMGGPLAIPVAGVRRENLVDTFTQARAAGARRHDAIDIMAPLGTPVVAAAPGQVEKLFASKDGGNTVYVRSPDRRRMYYYAHLDRYAPSLREGQRLSRGDAIGTVGFTGNANPAAPHLHFAVWQTAPQAKWWDQAEAVNPYGLLRGR